MTTRYAVECYECGYIALDTEDDSECLGCGEDNVVVREVKECPIGRACNDEYHHYGLGLHLLEV